MKLVAARDLALEADANIIPMPLCANLHLLACVAVRMAMKYLAQDAMNATLPSAPMDSLQSRPTPVFRLDVKTQNVPIRQGVPSGLLLASCPKMYYKTGHTSEPLIPATRDTSKMLADLMFWCLSWVNPSRPMHPVRLARRRSNEPVPRCALTHWRSADDGTSALSQDADMPDGQASRPSGRMLEAALDRARAAGKPLFISALASDGHSQGQPGWMTAPQELLACLQGEVATQSSNTTAEFR